jgi:hypothetical protein
MTPVTPAGAGDQTFLTADGSICSEPDDSDTPSWISPLIATTAATRGAKNTVVATAAAAAVSLSTSSPTRRNSLEELKSAGRVSKLSASAEWLKEKEQDGRYEKEKESEGERKEQKQVEKLAETGTQKADYAPSQQRTILRRRSSRPGKLRNLRRSKSNDSSDSASVVSASPSVDSETQSQAITRRDRDAADVVAMELALVDAKDATNTETSAEFNEKEKQKENEKEKQSTRLSALNLGELQGQGGATGTAPSAIHTFPMSPMSDVTTEPFADHTTAIYRTTTVASTNNNNSRSSGSGGGASLIGSRVEALYRWALSGRLLNAL